jgi:hypothetical protein
MINAENNFDKLPNFIKDSINEAIKSAFDKEYEEAIKRLNQKKPTIIAGVLLNVKKMIDVRTLDNNFIFTIKIEQD